MLRVRAFQVGVMLLAAAAGLLFLRWLVIQPEPISPPRHEVAFLVEILFHRDPGVTALAPLYSMIQGLAALTGLAAAALAVVLAIRVADQIAARRLAASLALGTLGVAYFLFVTTDAGLRELIGWRPDAIRRAALDTLAFGIGFWSLVLMARFFLAYPRKGTAEEWGDHYRRQHANREEERQRGSSLFRFVPSALRLALAKAEARDPLSSAATLAAHGMATVRFWDSRVCLVVALILAVILAAVDFLAASQAALGRPWAEVLVGRVVASWILVLVFAIFLGHTLIVALNFQMVRGIGDDRHKVAWIRSALVVGAWLGVAVQSGLSYLIAVPLAERGVYVPVSLLFGLPTYAAIQIWILLFVVALALSVFYRGAVDPRLAARRVTLVGTLGVFVTFLFVLIERTVSAKLVAMLDLSPDSGALVAGALVAATVVPLRSRAESAVNALVGRYLPLDSVIGGERKTLAVVISDLSGYTALSSRDEKQALLLAALLQRQATKLTQAHDGRVVKSMGDAVLLAFDDAKGAATVLVALHRDFQPVAAQLGLEPLPVHSGAHWGEVTVARDGDVYGQTVNITARIQGSAETGQIVVSGSFFEAAGGGEHGYRSLGDRQFRNVAEPVTCLELQTTPLPSACTSACAPSSGATRATRR